MSSLTPFVYPTMKQKRKEFPRFNSSFRDELEKEFHHSCVYCMVPDGFSEGSFQIEHYRPKSLFPELEKQYDNLFWACSTCNQLKTNYWADRKDTVKYIANPCEDIMSQHLKYSNLDVVAKSETGSFMCQLLHFNDSKQKTQRERIAAAIKDMLLNFARLAKKYKKICSMPTLEPKLESIRDCIYTKLLKYIATFESLLGIMYKEFLRKRRGMTKTQLAELTELTVRSISSYEAGDATPSQETSALLAKVLCFPIEFFMADSSDTFSSESASFRALSTITARQRDSAIGAGQLAIELSNWIASRFDLPAVNIPILRGYTPEAAAESVRASWGLGEKPIKNMVHLLEAYGTRVFSLAEECNEVDAFSVWSDGIPYIFLNTMKSSERSRFDAAHELGHLVLHQNGTNHGREAEQEANHFASCFLMPRGSVLANAPRYPSIDTIIQLKHNWNVSAAALTYRLFSLKLISEWQYRTLCITMAEKGYKKEEPSSIPRETSALLKQVFDALREDGVTKANVAKLLYIDEQELDALVFGLVMTKIDGGKSSSSKSPPNSSHLKLLSTHD